MSIGRQLLLNLRPWVSNLTDYEDPELLISALTMINGYIITEVNRMATGRRVEG